MPGRALQPFECHLQHQTLVCGVHDLTHRTEPLQRVAADKPIDLNELLVGEAEIGFAHRNQNISIFTPGPNSERIVGIIRGPLAVAALRVHQNRVDDERVPLPFPPETLWPTGHIRRVAPFEHDAFDRFSVGTGAGGLRIGAGARKLGPRGERYEGREINA